MSLGNIARVLCTIAASVLVPAAALGTNVEIGYELYKSGDPTVQSFFDVYTIPPGFFDPGSDPFQGQVAFVGHPLGGSPYCPGDIGPTDCIVLRNEMAVLPGPGSTFVVPIEIVALNLVSVNPIVVTYNGGSNPEPWNIGWTLSPAAPSTGTRTIRQETPTGGTFDAVFYVVPRFTFSRQSDGATRILDIGGMGLPPEELRCYSVPWSYDNGGLNCPDCVANFYPSSYTQSGPYAVQSVSSGCYVSTRVPALSLGGAIVLGALLLIGGLLFVVRRRSVLSRPGITGGI